jgi:hypothetical protein
MARLARPLAVLLAVLTSVRATSDNLCEDLAVY